MRKILKYTLRVLFGLLLLIVLLLTLALGLTQTRFFKEKLPPIIEKQASNFLNGNLTVGRIGGNFFSGLVLEDLLLMQNSDTIAYVEKINAHYNLLPLLHSKLEISSAKLHKPYVYLEQLNDSTWNLQQIVKPTDTPKDTTDNPTSFSISLSKFLIEEGRIRIESADSIIPERIEDLNTNLSLHYSSEKQEITVNKFNLKTHSPDFVLQDLTFQITRNLQNIELKNFHLKTAQNQVNAEGEYNPEPELKAKVEVNTTRIQLKEFEFFLPDLKLPANPVFNLTADARNDSLLAKIELTEGEESIKIDLKLANFPAVIYNQTDTMVRYKITGLLNKIHLAHWSGMPDLDNIINGNLTAEGVGIQPESAVAKLSGDFKNSIIENKRIAQLNFNLNLDHGNAKGNASASGDFGSVQVYPEIHSFMGKRPSYQARILAEKLNLAQLTGTDTLQSNLNLTANISGSGFDPKTLSAHAKIIVSPSQFTDIQIDTLFAEGAYSGQNITVDSLLLKTQSVEAHAHGNYSMNSTSDLVFSANIKNLNEFRKFIPLEDLKTSGNIDAHLWGTADSVNIDALVALGKTEFDSIYADTITLKINALLAGGDTTLNATLVVNNLWNASFQIDSVTAKVTAGLDSALIDAHLANHELNTSFNAGINWSENIKVRLNEWLVKYKDQKWTLQQPPATFEMDSLTYRLENFALVQNDTDSTARIAANGTFSMNGAEDFKLELTNIDIAEMAKTFYKEIDATGKLNLTAALQGSAISPELKGNFEIKNPVFNKYKIAEFGGEVDYKNDLLNFATKIVPKDSGKIELTGKLPLLLRLDSIHYNMNPTDPIDATLIVDRFPLNLLQVMDLTEQIEGYLEGKVTVDGTVESPNPEGSLQLQNAALRIRQYGIDYRKIDFKIAFLRDKVNLDTFRIQTSDGKMTASGQMDFSSDFYKGDISNTNIAVKFDRFNPVDHRQFNMEVSGDASLSGKKGEVVFGGNLNIPEAQVYLPFVMNLMGKFNAPEMPEPILLRELQKSGEWHDTLHIERMVNISPPDSLGSNYFKNFTGKLDIKIPKNTWIKNEDFRIELSGDLELLKNKEFFEVFGTVDVVRGQYDLFGRTFIIEDGTVSFQGGEDVQPELNIKANYAFRNAQKAQQKLSVNITGTASSPKVSFTLDGSSINEGDALSYIVFGRSLNELTMSQQDNISGGGGGSLAESAAASMLSSQISKFLGDKLDVDYIEIKSDGGFENATVTVGKYITNDLFVNYEQQFGETTRKDVDRYRVELEYELFKFLFIQLNNSSSDSGFNVIIKLDSK